MITLFVIGIIVLVIKLIWWAFKAAWTILKAVIWVVGLPFVLVGLFLVGLIKASCVLLLVALVLAFVIPAIKGN